MSVFNQKLSNIFGLVEIFTLSKSLLAIPNKKHCFIRKNQFTILSLLKIGMKKMEYKTRKWHDKCFQCVVCKTQVGSKPFIIPNETDVYCVGCFEEKFATKCTKCKKIMTTGGVTFKNEVWSIFGDFFDNERTVWTVNGVLGGLIIFLVVERIKWYSEGHTILWVDDMSP